MARQPKLRKKKVGTRTYWYTKAGGDTYFGAVADVPHKEARRLFRTHISNLADDAHASKKGMTAGDLMDDYLGWLKEKRAPSPL